MAETYKIIRQLNVLWMLFSLFEVYLIAIGRLDAFTGIIFIGGTFLLIWWAGTKFKQEELENLVIGDKVKGQWDR